MFQLPDEPKQKLPFVCKILDDLLLFLQTHKIKQQSVGQVIGVANLSKLRNPNHLSERYSPQKITDLINNIISHYQITWQQQTTAPYHLNFSASHLLPTPPQKLYYAYYYYSRFEQKVTKALLTITNANRPTATLTFYANETPIYTYPPALLNTTPNHLVLQFMQPDSNFFSLAILYCGSYSWQQLPFLTGTYAGIRQRDNKPVCGRLALQKFDTQEQFTELLPKPIPKPIQQWLNEKSDETHNSVLYSLNDF